MTPAKKQRFPTIIQSIIIIASGIVLGLSSCVGFLGTMNSSGQSLAPILMIGFFGGVIIAFIGCVLLLIAVARALVDAFRLPAPAAPSLLIAEAPAGAAAVSPSPGLFGITASREQPVLRQLQIALVVLMLLPLASVATSVLIVLNRLRAYPSIFLFLSSYVLSQVPYAFALARTRRGLDRLGIAIAFAASCVFFVEGLLPLFRPRGMFLLGPDRLLFFWPGLFLIGHVVVAVFAFRAGRLAPPEGDDLPLVGASFVGVIVYLVFIRFLEAHFLPFLLR
ncbi:MAG TPA: hypothetical protein VMD78_14065 [Candidatus Baltobacteraceae bacterium]|nr:hypothetical protein [Candidatus Baltobacteraceae bacterium]